MKYARSLSYDVDCPKMRLPEVAVQSMGPLSRKESYKDQRKKYRHEKKRAAKELLSTFKDPSVIVLEDWLKVRGTLKGWTKLWCVLKPNALLIYKSSKAKSSHWKGTVLLNVCELIERPSKKDGFCFKLFHPLEQSIWTAKGPQGETIGAMGQPLPSSHLIFRAPSQAAGKCWMEALEISIGCTGLGSRSVLSRTDTSNSNQSTSSANKLNEWEIEKHFKDHDLDDASHTDENEHHRESGNFSGTELASGSESDSEESTKLDYNEFPEEDIEPIESDYVPGKEEYIGDVGSQTEELAEENKSIIWFILKQVRPGMDLSKVVLPTFILEPRSFLDKLSDYYYHADIISKAVLEDDPLTRMKEVLRWYLSGFYKKPKGLKKPYNPILGESFRCYWNHPNGSRTFYVAEQVSHHPPISAFYVTNRQEGFSYSATILAKSKFYGNSTSAILDGTARLSLLPRGEDYVMNMPYAYCKGILLGTLTVELGGKVNIECEKTGYSAELEFKLKPFLSSGDVSNLVVGKLKLGKETLAHIEGRWDRKILLKDKKTREEEVFWEVTNEVKEKRLPRFTINMDEQHRYESEKLWKSVSDAIRKDDQEMATVEKSALEEEQRQSARLRKEQGEDWISKYFIFDPLLNVYIYKYSDLRPWDPRTDQFQYEYDYVISTKTRLKAPMVRTASIISVDMLKCDSGRTSTLDSKRLQGVKELHAGDGCLAEEDTYRESNNYNDSQFPNSITSNLQEIQDTQRNLLADLKEIKDKVSLIRVELSEIKNKVQNAEPYNGLILPVILSICVYSLLHWFFVRFLRS